MERLTLEEAIVHAKEVAEKNYRGADFESIDYIDDDIKTNCIKCAEEHMQLAEWLEELKSYKEAEEQGLLVRLPCLLVQLYGTYAAWIFGKTWYVELNAAKMVNSFCGQIMMSGSGN